MPEEQKTQNPPIEYKRSETFKNEYANNAFLESTAWDLKINFGQIDLTAGPNSVIQSLAVTMPWSQIKVLIYFLRLHLLVHESNQGRITVPKGVIQPLPVRPTEEEIRANPNMEELDRAVHKLYDDFVDENPEAKIAI